ncbi:MAG TPA: glutamate racemase [Ktedonobacteraceae bacterium]|nr:glutamate racemase [Ktedonobacteraceae bacterium]
MEYIDPEDEEQSQIVYPARDAERSQQAFDHERGATAGQAAAPIGVFDSGAGGLTVLSALRAELPREHYIYLGDTAHIPYGQRSDAEITELSIQGCHFLVEQGVKMIVVACNTASQAALATLRATFSIPFVGVVPAVKPAARMTRKGRIGVAATNQASRATYLRHLIDEYADGIAVYAVGCPELVTLVERGELDGPVVEETVRQALLPILREDIDVLALGCTHFPALRPVIERVAGSRVQVIDSGAAVARRAHDVLDAEALLQPSNNGALAAGELRVWCSGDPAAFSAVASKILGYPVVAAQFIAPESQARRQAQ